MTSPASLDRLRRVLLLATGAPPPTVESPQLELSLWGDAAPASPSGDEGAEGERAHELVLELALLVRMEALGLVASPLRERRRRRVGLGGDPPLRALAEWEHAPLVEDPIWMRAQPAPSREQAYADGLGRIRAIAAESGLAPARVREVIRRVYFLHAPRPTGDLAGLVLSHALRFRLIQGPRGRRSFRPDAGGARSAGSVHTPADLAEEIIRVAWQPEEAGEDFHVLDPSCGGGQFLVAAAPRLCQDTGPNGARPRDPQKLRGLNRLHGVDLDPRAARIAAWNLSFWAAAWISGGDSAAEADGSGASTGTGAVAGRRAGAGTGAGTGPGTGAGTGPGTGAGTGAGAGTRDCGAVLDALFGRSFPYFLGTQIQIGNALQIEPSSFSPGFNWPRRFPGSLQRHPSGFDLVIGNPPWVSFGLRDRVAAPEEERRYYERLYPAGTQYKLSLFPLFIELAIRLCRPGGRHAYLVPDTLLSGFHLSRIRRLLQTECDLLELGLLEGLVWSGVNTGHTAYYVVRKKGGSELAPVSVSNRTLRRPATRGGERGRGGGERGRGSGRGEARKPFVELTRVAVPAMQYSPAGPALLTLFRDESEIAFVSTIQNAPVRIRDVAWTYSGLIARHGQRTVQAEEPRAQFLLRDRRGRLVHRDDTATEKWQRALHSGSEVLPYQVRWAGGWVYLPEEREEVTRLFKSGFDLARYRRPKIFLRQTGDSLTAALDREGFFCFNNVHLVGVLDGANVPPILLAGILMSKPMQMAYSIWSAEAGRPLAQVDLKTVANLPYPVDSAGQPIGMSGTPAPNAAVCRKAIQEASQAIAHEDPAAVLAQAESYWKLGPEPASGGDVPGASLLTLLLVHLLEHHERLAGRDRVRGYRPGTGRRRPGIELKINESQELLDLIFSLILQVPLRTGYTDRRDSKRQVVPEPTGEPNRSTAPAHPKSIGRDTSSA